jgi:hypothetical protein
MIWKDLTGFQQITFVIASAASLVLLILLILMLIGIGNDAGFDDVDSGDFDAGSQVDTINDSTAVDASSLNLITFRGALSFLAIGGWVAFSFNAIMVWPLALLIGLVSGVAAAFLVAFFFKQIYKLEEVGNLDYKYAIGKQASVYIRIPKARTGTGKVIVQFNDRYLEVDAVTNSEEDLLPNSFVKITELLDSSLLLVEVTTNV